MFSLSIRKQRSFLCLGQDWGMDWSRLQPHLCWSEGRRGRSERWPSLPASLMLSEHPVSVSLGSMILLEGNERAVPTLVETRRTSVLALPCPQAPDLQSLGKAWLVRPWVCHSFIQHFYRLTCYILGAWCGVRNQGVKPHPCKVPAPKEQPSMQAVTQVCSGDGIAWNRVGVPSRLGSQVGNTCAE